MFQRCLRKMSLSDLVGDFAAHMPSEDHVLNKSRISIPMLLGLLFSVGGYRNDGHKAPPKWHSWKTARTPLGCNPCRQQVSANIIQNERLCNQFSKWKALSHLDRWMTNHCRWFVVSLAGSELVSHNSCTVIYPFHAYVSAALQCDVYGDFFKTVLKCCGWQCQLLCVREVKVRNIRRGKVLSVALHCDTCMGIFRKLFPYDVVFNYFYGHLMLSVQLWKLSQ